MPAAKGKGGTTSHRYRPASEFDDATLAQKREYWRNKKREQRARLSEERGKPVQASRGEKLLHVNSSVPSSFKVSSPLQISDDSAPHIGSTVADCSLQATENQKEKWFQTMKLNKVLPHLPSLSAPISAEAAEGDTATAKCTTAKVAVHREVTSTLSTSSTVPPVTRIANGSSTKTAPPPCVSMQGASVPKTQQKAQAASSIQPKLLPSSKTTGGMLLVSSPCSSVCIKTEDTATQKSALVMVQRAKGNAQPSQESEEERAARRREQWRIKKREQRAKLAARLAKARERTQGVEMAFQRRVGLTGCSVLPSQPFLRGGQKQCAVRVKMPVKRENDKLQNGEANTLIHQIKVQNPYEDKAKESQRRFSSFFHLSNVTRGIARCKTPRQRFIEAQKNFLIQRNSRCKSPLMLSVFSSRNIPKINPNDSPEQIIAKRREYWRIKKREQRAKLSMEMKARLKEKDSLMRRVKRYQKILEDMRKARAVNALAHASETIGGFIKEDGTLTVNMPTNQSTAAGKSEGELHVPAKNSFIKPSQLQSEKQRVVTPTRIQPTPPPLCPAQVKVSFPLTEHSVNKPPRLLSIRPQSQPESTAVPHTHSAGQLTLTHPQTPPNSTPSGSTTGSNLGGCVMKMAVSSSAPSLSALSIGQGLTEEDRMAKKREYWRIKKREQRAARAVWLKQGVLQARANTSLQKRKAQKQEAKPARPAQPPPSTTTPVMPSAKEIKQESGSVPAVDLNSQPEQAICPDIKPPTSPASPTSPLPTPQPEPDPALSADSQATTLLAVASMKKLLEESLSAVTECKNDRADVIVEKTEKTSEQGIKPDLPQPFFDVAPIAANQALQIKSRPPDSDVLQADCKTLQLSSSDPSSSEVALIPTSEHSSNASSNFTVNPSVEASEGPSSPRRTHRLRPKKPGHQNCCSPEPPKLHHLTTAPPDQQQQPCEQLQNSTLASAQRYCSVAMEQSSHNSLQKKREYWKLMKRQQRARLKARGRERQAECSNRPSARNIQAPGLVIINTVKAVNTPAKPALQPKPVPPLTAVSSIPAVLVVTQTCNADTLQVKLPVTSREQNNTGSLEIMSNTTVVPEEWASRSTDTDSVPSLPTLKPPDNPLSSINLQPIEPPGQSPDSILSPIKIPCTQRQSPTHELQFSPKLSPISTMVPPKPTPGESEEDFLKRKREYWRIKKKEQRARKAIRDKGLTSRRVSNNCRPILPAQDLQTQDCGQWVNSSEESGHLISTSTDTNPDSFEYSNYAAPIEDESELIFADYDNNEEEGPISDAVWRNRYLMDYDPLNQLLVCMVCGELQYSHSLEGVRTHIDEAHPHTLTLEPGEKQRILEAWDEQVSQRERFFTSQLQQHSGALAEAHRN